MNGRGPTLVAPAVRRLARLSTGQHFLAFAVDPPRVVQLTAGQALLLAIVLQQSPTAEVLRTTVERRLAARRTPLRYEELIAQLVDAGLLEHRTQDAAT